MKQKIQTPECYIEYAYLDFPDKPFSGGDIKKGSFKVTCVFKHTEYTDEQKRDLHNLLCHLTKMHPGYDNTRSVYDQIEELKVAKKNSDGFYTIKPEQKYNPKGNFFFKPDVIAPNGNKYLAPQIGAVNPWEGIKEYDEFLKMPKFGKGTTGKVTITPVPYNWTPSGENVPVMGLRIGLDAVNIITLVEYQPEQPKKVESPNLTSVGNDTEYNPFADEGEDHRFLDQIDNNEAEDSNDDLEDDIPF